MDVNRLVCKRLKGSYVSDHESRTPQLSHVLGRDLFEYSPCDTALSEIPMTGKERWSHCNSGAATIKFRDCHCPEVILGKVTTTTGVRFLWGSFVRPIAHRKVAGGEMWNGGVLR